MEHRSKIIYVLVYILWSGLAAYTQNTSGLKLHPIEYECVARDFFGKSALAFYLTDKDIAEADKTILTLEEEKESAMPIITTLQSNHKLLDPSSTYPKIWKILQKLLKEFLSIPYPKRFDNYEIYFVESEVPNAFTAGAKIFFTTALLNELKDDKSMLAFVLYHEIGHNELKHLHYNLKRRKALGESLAKAGEVMFLSLNQFNELEADCFSIDVMNYLKKDAQKGVQFFEILKKYRNREAEEKYYYLNKILSTHPLDGERYQCLLDFIQKTK